MHGTSRCRPSAYPVAIPIIWLFKGWLQQGFEAIRAELLA
jgi:hypothetical protein